MPQVHGLLSAISERVEAVADGWRVAPPSHRFDIRIEPTWSKKSRDWAASTGLPKHHALASAGRGICRRGAGHGRAPAARDGDRGYQEAITYSFVDPALQSQLFPGVDSMALANPISAELGVMRVSLWPGLIQMCRENLRRQQARVRLFEAGRKFVVRHGELSEVDTLAGIAAGARWPEQWSGGRDAVDFYDVKADVEALLAMTGEADAVRFEAAELACLQPGRAARLFKGSQSAGWLGELHPHLVRTLGLNITPLLFELDTEACFGNKQLQYKHISKFPSVRRDLAVVVDEGVSFANCGKVLLLAPPAFSQNYESSTSIRVLE